MKGVLKICSRFTGEHRCRSVISRKMVCNFTEITPRHGCSPVNLLHIFRTPFIKNTSGWLLPHLIIGTYSYLKKKNLNPYENISAEQEITSVINRTNITESNSLHKI